jgi:metal-responsive CopG/Arc/MetJ family transcriptional regulator
MRITIELPDALRARVMALSATRGQRGYGKVIVEAVEHYLESLEGGEDRLREVLEMAGSWSRAEAERARAGVAEARASYRKLES